MRQVGILGAACIYAIDNNLQKLELDHQHANEIANCLREKDWVKSILPVETNMIIFEVDEQKTSVLQILDLLKEKNILAVQFGPKQIRLVFHLDIKAEMIPILKSKMDEIIISKK